MCVHWLTGDGLRREDGLRASVPARGGGFIATDRSVVCVRCCCVRSFLPENDRERNRCVWLSPRAPRPPSLTHRAEGGSLSRPRRVASYHIRHLGRRVPESCMPPLPGARTYMRQSATGTAGRTWEGVRGGECCHQSTPTWHMPDDRVITISSGSSGKAIPTAPPDGSEEWVTEPRQTQACPSRVTALHGRPPVPPLPRQRGPASSSSSSSGSCAAPRFQ